MLKHLAPKFHPDLSAHSKDITAKQVPAKQVPQAPITVGACDGLRRRFCVGMEGPRVDLGHVLTFVDLMGSYLT